MARSWKVYQEEAAAFFQSLGLDAQLDIRIKGVRTTHDVDVLVKSQHVGFQVTWIVECKRWKTRVSKLHVLALREIAADLGADRGILLSEVGFQKGAVEAAALTNVQVTSLANVRESARAEIIAVRIRALFDRAEGCRSRYWAIPKNVRIGHGLRPNVGTVGYSLIQQMELAGELLSKAMRSAYPIEPEHVQAYVLPDFPKLFTSADALFAAVEPMIVEAESRLSAYESTV